MSLRKSIIAIGILGLAAGGPAAWAAASALGAALYCAEFIKCDNSTSCHMYGDMANLMYQAGPAFLENGTQIIPFSTARATSISRGEVQAYYTTPIGNWPSSAVFFSDGNVKLYPRLGNDTKWSLNLGGKDTADCSGETTFDCPFTQEPTNTTSLRL